MSNDLHLEPDRTFNQEMAMLNVSFHMSTDADGMAKT